MDRFCWFLYGYCTALCIVLVVQVLVVIYKNHRHIAESRRETRNRYRE